MSVREATFEDIESVVDLMRQAHQRSIYFKRTTFDEIRAKQTCARALQRHGHTNLGGMLFLVSSRDGYIDGFVIGLIDLLYPCLAEYCVSDVMTYFGTLNPVDFLRMLTKIDEWAERSPRVIEVFLGVSDVVDEIWERTGELYEKRGYQRCGAMFRKFVNREVLEVSNG